MLSSELSLLAIYGLVVAIVLGLKTTGMIGQLGMGYMLSARDNARALTGMLARVERSMTNSITALALVAPPVLILGLQDRFSGESLLAMQVFVAARIVYFPAYALGIAGLRTLVWLMAYAAIVVLYFLAV